MTEKGKKRAKALCRSVGIVLSVEIDIEQGQTNKVTVNLYDKDMMPLVDQLYTDDNANNISRAKDENEGAADGLDGIFADFVGQVERDIDSILIQDALGGKKSSKTTSPNDKGGVKGELLMSAFNEGPIEEESESD